VATSATHRQHRRWSAAGRVARRIVVGGILSARSACGASRIRVETDYLQFFSVDSIFARQHAIAEALGGTQPIYVSIEGDGPGPGASTCWPPCAICNSSARATGVDGSLSLADYVAICRAP
jgi:hypothetical protein